MRCGDVITLSLLYVPAALMSFNCSFKIERNWAVVAFLQYFRMNAKNKKKDEEPGRKKVNKRHQNIKIK